MKKGEMLRLIDELSKLGAKEIRLTGGEPTIYPLFKNVVAEIKKKGILVSVITNGSNLKNLSDFFKKNVDCAIVSLDSCNPKVHDRIRGFPGLFNKAVEGMKNIKNGKTELAANIIVSRANYRDLPQMILGFRKFGIKRINLIPIRVVKGMFLDKDDIRLYNKEIIPKIRDSVKRTGMEISSSLYLFGRNKGEIENSAKGDYTGRYYRRINCYFSRYSAFIDDKGDVYPCPNLPYLGASFSFGNIRDDSLSNLWFSKRRAKLLKKLSNNRGLCKGCDPSIVLINLVLHKKLHKNT